MENFGIGQIVKGNVGHFIILGFRMIGGEDHAQVKSFDVKSQKMAAGEMALPVSILKAI